MFSALMAALQMLYRPAALWTGMCVMVFGAWFHLRGQVWEMCVYGVEALYVAVYQNIPADAQPYVAHIANVASSGVWYEAWGLGVWLASAVVHRQVLVAVIGWAVAVGFVCYAIRLGLVVKGWVWASS